MIKNVVVCVLAILLSNCSYTPSTASRSAIITKPCEYSLVDMKDGTVKELIEANETNSEVNAPTCKKKFEQINKYTDTNDFPYILKNP